MRGDEAAKGLARVGGPIAVHDAQGAVAERFTGVLRPLRYKNRMYVKPEPTPIGADDQSYYLLYAPPDVTLPPSGGGYLSDGTGRFTVIRQEVVRFGALPMYIWAILRDYTEV